MKSDDNWYMKRKLIKHTIIEVVLLLFITVFLLVVMELLIK
jgi:hypothetical protein